MLRIKVYDVLKTRIASCKRFNGFSLHKSINLSWIWSSRCNLPWNFAIAYAAVAQPTCEIVSSKCSDCGRSAFMSQMSSSLSDIAESNSLSH